MSKEGSTEAPIRHPINFEHPDFINQEKLDAVRVENAQQLAEIEKQRKESIEGILLPIQDEIELLQAKLNGNEEEIRQNQEILRLKKAILAVNPNADTSGVAAMVQQRDELRKQAEAADQLKQQYEALAGSIAGELTGAFKAIITGSKSAEEALADAFEGIANAFIDMAMKMIQQWLVMQIMGIVSGGAGGGAAGGGLFGAAGGSAVGMGKGFLSFEGGGYTGDGPRSGGADGRGGFPALLHPGETVVDHTQAMGRYSMSSGGMSATGSNSESTAGAGPAGSDIPTFKLETTVIGGIEYATLDQVRAMGAEATKRGAAMGEMRVMSSLKNSRSKRSRVGI